jgi:transcriptional regulator with XRE-family HTH domain
MPEASENQKLTSEQVRAARALLRWEQRQLAAASGVSLPSVKRLELRPGQLAARAPTVAAIREALEEAGVEFTNSASPGVRLRVKEIYANPLNDEWGVVVRWTAGAPIEWTRPDVARKAADEAEARGDDKLADMLREAANKAENNAAEK